VHFYWDVLILMALLFHRLSIHLLLMVGCYQLDSEAFFCKQRQEIRNERDTSSRQNLEQLLQDKIDLYSNFLVDRGIIRSENSSVQELSLQTATIKDGALRGRAIWH
jgi:hypothetical protein